MLKEVRRRYLRGTRGRVLRVCTNVHAGGKA
jgi:hypothetical protein